MDLSEFREELGDVLFHKFFDENYKTARDVLDTPKETLVATLGVEAEKINEIVEMLKKGLEEAEIEEEGEEVEEAAPEAKAETTEAEPEPSPTEGSTSEPADEQTKKD